jgi:uncharacterized membrane protein
MELTLKTSIFLVAILLTGLSAGLFYAWEFSVIPGTKRITDLSYLETMQSINRAILNPGFFVIFFGSLLFLIASTYLQYQEAGVNSLFLIVLLAALIYLIGTFGVTAFGNVRLNESLDAINLSSLDSEQLETIRKGYEAKWNHLHTIRTTCSVLSFATILISQLFK